MTAQVTETGTIVFQNGGNGCVLTLQRTLDGADVGAAFQVTVSSGVAILPSNVTTGVTGNHVYGVRIVATTCPNCTGAASATVAYTNTCP